MKYLDPRTDRRKTPCREPAERDERLARKLEAISDDYPELTGVLRESAERIRDLSSQVRTLALLARREER